MVMRKITALILIGTLIVSAASCSSNDEDSRETTTATTSEETTTATTTEETTEEPTASEETTVEITTEESVEETAADSGIDVSVADDDPELTEFTDPEVRQWARWYLDQGYRVQALSDESTLGPGTGMVEGFAAIADGDSMYEYDFVFDFPDYESAAAFFDKLDGSSNFGPITMSDDYNFTFADGHGTATMSENYVLVMVIE